MNGRGVSVLVGFILLMLTLMIFVSLIQAYVVPSVCKREELRKFNSLMEDVQEIDKSIIDNRLSTITLDLGITYPKYMFLLTPPAMGSSVDARRFDIRVSYDEILPNGTVIRRNDTYTSSRINVSPNYFYMRGYVLTLENTAIFEFNHRRFVLALLGQQMFGRDRISISIINATFPPFSSTQPVDIVVDPVSYGGYVLAKNVTVEFETSCPEYWRNIAPVLRDMGYDVTVTGNDVSVSYGNVTRLYLSYTLLFKGTSVSALQYRNLYEPKPSFVIPTAPTTSYNVTVDESIKLGVEVLDEYNNPVRGYPVNVSLTGVGKVTPGVAYTDSNGVAEVVFSSNTTGKALVTFETPVGNVTYKIDVLSSGVTIQFPYGITYDANMPGAIYVFGNYVSSLPSTNTTPATPITDTSAITKDDGVYLVSVAPLDYHAAQRFEIYGLNTSNVMETYVYWNGYGVGYNYTWWGMGWLTYDNGSTLYLWNFTAGRYDEMVSTEYGGEIWLSVGLNASQMKNYIKNGKMIVLVMQNGITARRGWWSVVTYNSTLATDYIGVFQIYR